MSKELFGAEPPDSWELLRVGDVAHVVGGSTPKSKEPKYWGGDIPWLGVADLTDYTEKRISHGARSITQAGYRSCATQLLPKDSVVFSSRAPIGYVAIADNPLCTSQGFKSLVLPRSLSPDYVYWWLKAAKPLAEALASGTTFKEVSGNATEAIPFPLPPRAEQDRIVEAIEAQMLALAEADASIRAAEQLLDAHRAATLEHVCLGSFVSRPPETSEGSLPGLPSGWKWRTVAELASRKTRAITDGPFGSNLKSAHYTDVGPRVIRLQNVGDGEFLDAEARISPEHFERLRAHEAKPGDVVVASLGETLPRACVVPQGLGPAIVKADCPRIRVGPEIDPKFLCAALNSAPVRAQAARLISGIGRPRLNLKKLKALKVPTPPPDEQATAIEILSIGDRLRRQLKRDLRGLDRSAALRRSILHHAFTGQLLPQNPDDEPAAVLFERIQRERAEREAELKAAKAQSRQSRNGGPQGGVKGSRTAQAAGADDYAEETAGG